jgi:succinyl-CoA synthetase beta subunit
MKIHEYQAKAILARYGVTTPRGEVAFSKEEAREGAARLRSSVVVVKAQIHAGGRGKAGGVKLAHSPDEAAEIASHMLGVNLVTAQTGPGGRTVKRVLIEEGLDIKRELYLSILVDRSVGKVVFMASASGGMDIEEVAKTNPEAIMRETIHPASGLQPYQARKLVFGLGLSGMLQRRPRRFCKHCTARLWIRTVHARNQSRSRHGRRPSCRSRRQNDL